MKPIFKLIILIACLIATSADSVAAQSIVSKKVDPLAAANAKSQTLPAEWSGIWKGSLTLIWADGKKENLAMELHVADVAAGAAAVPGAKTWRILYGLGAEQTTRPYEIMPVPNEANRFVVDEKNGMFIDNQLVGNLLFSQFKVTTNLVTTRFELVGDEIKVEMTMFDLNTPRQSKLTGGTIEVASYRFRSVQSGVLRRERKR